MQIRCYYLNQQTLYIKTGIYIEYVIHILIKYFDLDFMSFGDQIANGRVCQQTW